MNKWDALLRTLLQRGRRIRSQHLTDEQLMGALDGELSDREARKTNLHLEGCWSCRTRSEEIEQAIHQVVHYRNAILKYRMRSSTGGGGKHLLAARLEQLDAGAHRVGLFQRVRIQLSPLRILGAVGIAAFAVLLLSKSFKSPTRVEAATLMREVAAAETARGSQAGVIVHRTISFSRRDMRTKQLQQRRIETWKMGPKTEVRRMFRSDNTLVQADWASQDGTHVRYQSADADAQPAGATQTIDGHPIWELLPSIEAFTAAVQDRAKVSVETTPSIYVLHYQKESNPSEAHLVNASLEVRRRDLHPVQQDFRVADENGDFDYQTVETGLELESANATTVKVFDVDPGVVSHSLAIANTPAPMERTASADETIRVLSVLDYSQALLAQNVQVTKDQAGTLVVHGVVEDAERKKELLRLLHFTEHDPSVRVALTTVAESAGAGSIRRPQMVQQVQSSAMTPATNLLRDYFSREQKLTGNKLEETVTAFSNDLLTNAADAQSHAAVLAQIARNTASGDQDAPSVAAQQQLHAMLHAHSAAIVGDMRELRRRLAPVVGEAADTEPLTAAPVQPLESACAELQELTGMVETAVDRTLAGDDSPDGGPFPISGKQFWRVVDRTEAVAAMVEARYSTAPDKK